MLLKAVKLLEEYSDTSYNKASKPIRVLIIFPPSTNAVKAMWTIHNETKNSSIGAKPPLGPMYIAAYLKQNSPHDVKMLDCQVENSTDEDIRKVIEDYQPDLVGISAWTEYWYDAWNCIQITKQVNPDIHVCVGGPHISIYPEITLKNSGCDSVVVGDGEVPFFWLANSIANGKIPADLPGLHTKGIGVKQGDFKFYIHGDLDTLTPPMREMLPYKKYTNVVGHSEYVTTMITSRGCPFSCTFCKLAFQKTLCHSAEYIVDEFQRIYDMGIKEIQIYDDTFTWSKKRLIKICQGIIERGIKIDWAIRDRVSSPTQETMEWLAKAGCTRIHYGVESGSDKTLKTIKKNITTAQALTAFKMAKSLGIQTLAYFMIGLPGETVEDIRETFRFAKKLHADYATFSVTVPYAGTEIYSQALERGVIPEDYWIEFAKNPTPGYVLPYFWEEFLSKEELLMLRDEGTRQFYFRPRYILRELMKLRNFEELKKKAKMALNVFQTSVLRKSKDIYLKPNVNVKKFANNDANPHSVRE
jgi:anaerobic magnesium-protoporphyrin IX monomethyl ester cyclase